MATVTVNGKEVSLGEGERLNCIQAAKRAEIEVPHYCWHPAMSVVASCRMCLVEVGDKKPDGSVAMQPKVVPGCQTPVKDGTVIVTNSAKVKQAQAATLEYLLLNHPLDCPTCDQAGECFLQDYTFKFGHMQSRLMEPKELKPDKDYIGDQITLFTDRCVMCTRCVRFTREISGTGELQVINRGSHEEIDIFPGMPINNKLAGNVVDICPVGALCSKDFLYKQRVWWLKSADSVCPDCSTGCSIKVDQNNETVYRLKPRENPQAQGHFMCDDGRFGWKYIHSDQRLKQPEMSQGDRRVAVDWDTALTATRNALKDAATKNPKAVAAVFSPWMTVEEAYLLAKHLKSLSSDVRLALGPVRVEGQDDHYPKDVRGNAQEKIKFTIRAEKCPNRRGVELVLQHFQGSIINIGDILGDAAEGRIDTLYFVGGDPRGGLDESRAVALAKVKTLVVQDILPSPVSARAHIVLAGGSFAERDGTFVNHAGLAQGIKRSIRSPEEARPDGRILWDLSGRKGLFNATVFRHEIAREIPALAALTAELSCSGVLLK
ncbi:MAG: 2Fe-2S iron-sulfur cluster binding domain-containing protein [Planctomycetes bacterium]|nr:2Fe-2S iron-sulfur cluster binding domain-containing protein [Planctomycetota bacterium]